MSRLSTLLTPPKAAATRSEPRPVLRSGRYDRLAALLAVTIFCDGGAQPNPGTAGAGAVITEDATGRVLAEISEPVGVTTSNVAEYRALILAQEEVLALREAPRTRRSTHARVRRRTRDGDA